MRRRKGRMPWWLILILILNLLIRIIPQEWIIGPAPTAENESREYADGEITRIWLKKG